MQFIAMFFQHRLYLPKKNAIFIFSQRFDPSFINRKRIIRNDLIDIGRIHIPQPFTFGTSSVRGIKRERMRSRIPVRNPGIRTHQMPAIVFNIPTIQRFNHHHPFTVFHGSSHRAFQAFQIDMVDNHLIDHNLDIMDFIPIHTHTESDFTDLPVYPCRNESFLP